MAQFPKEQSKTGSFKRQENAFRDWVKRPLPHRHSLRRHLSWADTVNFDHIKRHYYVTHEEINPDRIVPIGPALDLDTPHGRRACERVVVSWKSN